MKKGKSWILAILFFFAGFSFPFSFAEEPAANALAQTYNKNTFRLFHLLPTEKQNIVISPYSLLSLLTVLSLTTQGQTQQEIETTLQIHHLEDIKLIAELNHLNQQLKKNNVCEKNTWCSLIFSNPLLPSSFLSWASPLSSNTAFWSDQSFLYHDQLKSKLGMLEDNHFFSINFKHAPERSRHIINHWIGEKTENTIPELLPQGSVTSNTKLILTQTILFHGAWQKPFKPQYTRTEIFHENNHINTKNKRTLLMHNHDQVYYFENEKLKLMILPYQGEQQVFIGILPQEKYRVRDIEKILNEDNFFNWIKQAKKQSVDYALPKLQFKYKNNEWVLLFKALGIHTVFSEHADFSPLTEASLTVSQIIHEAHIQFDEKGTIASAATAAIMLGTAFTQPKKMIFNQPFLFLILDKTTNTILFMGKFNRPE